MEQYFFYGISAIVMAGAIYLLFKSFFNKDTSSKKYPGSGGGIIRDDEKDDHRKAQ